MEWFVYLLMALSVLNVILTICSVGRPRRRVEPSDAALTFMFSAAYLVGLAFLLRALP
jgi:hypothetical protein